jgi:hypothetical protein
MQADKPEFCTLATPVFDQPAEKKRVVLRSSWEQSGTGRPDKIRGNTMDRRTLLLGLLGGLAAAPAMIATASSVEAGSGTQPPTPEPQSEPASGAPLTGSDLDTVQADWTAYGHYRRRGRRIVRRTSRRVARRRYY